MLGKAEVVDKIEVLPETGCVQIRRAIIISDDGQVVSRTYHRHVLSPGDPIDAEPDNVQAVCNVIWTPEVLRAWADFQAAQAEGPQ